MAGGHDRLSMGGGNDGVWAGMAIPEQAKAGNLFAQTFAATTCIPAFVRFRPRSVEMG